MMHPKDKANQIQSEYGLPQSFWIVDEILQEISHNQKFDWLKERQDGEETVVYWVNVRIHLR